MKIVASAGFSRKFSFATPFFVHFCKSHIITYLCNQCTKSFYFKRCAWPAFPNIVALNVTIYHCVVLSGITRCSLQFHDKDTLYVLTNVVNIGMDTKLQMSVGGIKAE